VFSSNKISLVTKSGRAYPLFSHGDRFDMHQYNANAMHTLLSLTTATVSLIHLKVYNRVLTKGYSRMIERTQLLLSFRVDNLPSCHIGMVSTTR